MESQMKPCQGDLDFKALYVVKELVTSSTIKRLWESMYGESICEITFDISDLQKSMSRSLRFLKLISHIGAELDQMLLSKINRKPYMASLMTLLHLTLSDIERPKSGPLRFRSITPRTRAELGHVSLLKHSQESIYGESICAIIFDLGPLKLLDNLGLRLTKL